MKHIYISILALLMFALHATAQMQGMMTMPSAPSTMEGTSLGANETVSYNGIALGNRVKLRGFVDFIFAYQDEDVKGEIADFSDTAADIDFLIFSIKLKSIFRFPVIKYLSSLCSSI